MTRFTKGGYKYRLEENLFLISSVTGYSVDLPYLRLFMDGQLICKHGYSWDGPSGPTLDMIFPFFYKSFIMPSAGHDALYQMLRHELIHPGKRKNADNDLRIWCIQRGMSKIRANRIYRVVSAGAGFAANPKRKRKIYELP